MPHQHQRALSFLGDEQNKKEQLGCSSNLEVRNIGHLLCCASFEQLCSVNSVPLPCIVACKLSHSHEDLNHPKKLEELHRTKGDHIQQSSGYSRPVQPVHKRPVTLLRHKCNVTPL